ncbi:MAG: hypothetical protein AB1324_04935 [Candidatus Micrarchaeota archaeon]
MEKGHIEPRELIVFGVLLIGVVAAAILLTGGPAESGAQKSSPGTVGALFDEGLARADSRFDAVAEDAKWNIRTYSWSIPELDETPESVPLKADDLRASVIRFPERYEDGLRAFAFREYIAEGSSAPPKIFGVAIFLGESAYLGEALDGGNLTIRYDPHPELSQLMEGCSVLDSRTVTGAGGEDIVIYDFSCKLRYGARP